MNSVLKLNLSKGILKKELVQSQRQSNKKQEEPQSKKAAGGSGVGSIVSSIKNSDIYAAVTFKGCSQRKGPFRQTLWIWEQVKVADKGQEVDRRKQSGAQGVGRMIMINWTVWS